MNRFHVVFALLGTVLMAVGKASASVTVEPSDRGQVVKIDGKMFAEYLTKAGHSPAVWPIIGPTGKPMTRPWPTNNSDPGDTKDHPHHQSLWFTHDEVSTPDVRRADFWSANRNDD